MNIIDYVETNMENFKTLPFNHVDSLVLSQFAYIHFTELVPRIEDDKEPVRIVELLKAENIPKMLEDVRVPKENHRLLVALCMSPRFRNISMCCYSECMSIDEEKQFAAVTYLLDNKKAYIAYRGTDSSFIGWKEDFNMAFVATIPSQEEGVLYLNSVAEKLPQMEFIMGGHSKGGNIAVYSAMECDSSIQSRIIKIYSHDGPGFKEDILKGGKYELIKDKIYKILPQSSIVGMLLHHQEDYVVVESKQFWVMQHDPFSWIVNKNDFKYVQGITNSAEHTNIVINQWLSTLDYEKREIFINALYSVVESTGIASFSNLTGDWYNNSISILAAIKGIDAETKDFIYKTLKSLFALYIKNLKVFLINN